MRNVTLGSTGITVPQNAFGALPLQRIGHDAAVEGAGFKATVSDPANHAGGGAF